MFKLPGSGAWCAKRAVLRSIVVSSSAAVATNAPSRVVRMAHQIAAAAGSSAQSSGGVAIPLRDPLRGFAVAVVAAGCTVGGFVLSLPTLLSTRYGLEAAVGLMNKCVPGRVEVAEVRGGWTSPVEVQCVKVYESKQGGALLLHMAFLTSHMNLWQILTAGRCSVVVTRPLLNCIYDGKTKDFKVIQWLEASGLIDSPPSASAPSVSHQQQQQQDPLSLSSSSPPSIATPISDTADSLPHAAASSPDATTTPPKTVSPSSPTHAELPPTGNPKRTWEAWYSGLNSKAIPQAAADGVPAVGQEPERSSLQNALTSVNKAQEAISSSVKSAVTSVKSPAKPAKPMYGPLAEMLGKVDSVMNFTAECFSPRLTVTAVDGRMMVSGEVKKMVGEHLHVSFVKGQQQLLQWGAETGEDVAWTHRPPMHAVAAEATEPCCIQMHAEHLDADIKLWSTGSSALLLHQPAVANLDFTPGLSRFGLASINPLLTEVAEVEGGGRVCVTFEPGAMQLPYTRGTIKVSPLHLGLGQSSRAAQLFSTLNALGGRESASKDAKSPLAGHLISASIGTMEVELEKGKQLAIHRVDMLLGRPDSKLPVHVAMWGTCDLANDDFSVNVGLPVESLASFGVRSETLPETYVMPAARVSATSLSVTTGAKRLSQLLMRQEVLKQQGSSRDGWVASVMKLASSSPLALSAVEGIDISIQDDIRETPVLKMMLPEWQMV